MLHGAYKYYVLFLLVGLCGCKNQEKYSSAVNSCIACDINAVDSVAKNIAKISDDQIDRFLCAIKKECHNNVEFTEASNYVLFKLLEERTESFVKIFSKSTSLDKEYVLRQIGSPLLDYNISALILKVEKSKGDLIIKQKIIESLNKTR